jgi:nucleoid-associated protein YgaU
MCAVFLFSAPRVDALDPSPATPNTSGAASYEEDVSKEAAAFLPSGVAPEPAADRARPLAAQSDAPLGNVGQGRADRIKAAVNQALAMPQPAQAPAEALPREKPLPDIDAVNARRQELKALIAEPSKPASELEARYLDQLRDEVSDTVVFQEAVAPDRDAPPVGSSIVADGGPGTYRVQRGDSLWKIAQARFGDGYKWRSIYEANRAHLRSVNVLSVGQVLAMPSP